MRTNAMFCCVTVHSCAAHSSHCATRREPELASRCKTLEFYCRTLFGGLSRLFCLEGGMLLRKTRHAPAADESATRGVSPKPWARAPPLVYATRSTVQIINRQLSSNRGYRNILAVRRRRDSMKIRTVDQAYLGGAASASRGAGRPAAGPGRRTRHTCRRRCAGSSRGRRRTSRGTSCRGSRRRPWPPPSP
jgi:hypothetical protein